jgi:hypothetical protein
LPPHCCSGAASGIRNSFCAAAVRRSSVASFAWMSENGRQYQSKPTQSTFAGTRSEFVTLGPASTIITGVDGCVCLIVAAAVAMSAGDAPRNCGSSSK